MRRTDGKWLDVIAGSYAEAEHEGLHWLQVNAENGAWHRVGGAAGIENPSFVALHPRLDRLYAVSETDAGQVVSYRYDAETGALAEINRQPSYGDAPCHLRADKSGRWLLVANYMTGNIAVYPLGEEGELGPKSDEVAHEGSGPRADRQERAHAHSINPIPDSDEWLACDLGTDELYVYRLDAERGTLERRHVAKARPGAGPRHAAFHPSLPLFYIAEELASAVSVYRYEPAGDLAPELLQSLSALPDGFAGENTCADIHLTESASYLYVSNRGHDSLAAFRIGADGLLQASGHASTLGRTPRNFAVVGDALVLVANQDSDSAFALRIGADGLPVAEPAASPAESGAAMQASISLPKPVCLQPLRR